MGQGKQRDCPYIPKLRTGVTTAESIEQEYESNAYSTG